MRRGIKALGLLVVVLLQPMMTQAVRAQSPYTFGYQGRLTEENGKPVNGPVALQVSFFRAASGGSPLLSVTEGLGAVGLQEGIFQIELTLEPGDYQAVFTDVGEPVYVQITDLTHAPDHPYDRQKIAMIPYAAKVPVDNKTIAFDGTGRATLMVSGAAGAGKVLGSDGNGNLTWIAQAVADGGQSTDTPSSLVKRDANGGFGADNILITPSDAGRKGVVVKGASAQTANLQEWQDNAGTVLSAIGNDGSIKLKQSGAGTHQLVLKAAAAMSGNVAYIFPAAPDSGKFLTTDAGGNLSWAAPSGAAQSLTAGSIPFADISGNFSEDNAHLFWDDANARLGIGTDTPKSALEVAGAIATPVASKTSAYSLTESDSVIAADATSSAFALTLPTAAGLVGRRYTVKKTDASAHAVTLTPFGVETIDGAPTYALSKQNDAVSVISDGASWFIDTATGSVAALMAHGSSGDIATNAAGTSLTFSNAGVSSITATNAAGSLSLGVSGASAALQIKSGNTKTSLNIDGDKVAIGTTAAAGSELEIRGSGTTAATSSLNVTKSDGTSSLFVRDDGTVGVGTTSPSAKLQVETATTSTVGLALRTTDNNTTKNLQEWQKSDGTALAAVAADGSLAFAGPNRRIATFTGDSYPVYLDAFYSSLKFSNGLFGTDLVLAIGANAPNYFGIRTRFGTNDSTYSNTDSQVLIQPNDLTYTTPISKNMKALVVRGAASQVANLQEWQNSSGTALTVLDASGNVGIGTTSPQNPLHVGGAARIDGTLFFNGGVDYIYRPSAGTMNTGSKFEVGSNLVVNRDQAATASTVPLRVRSSASQTGHLSDWEDENGGVLAAVTAAGGGYFVGNVGIGTASPTARLDIRDGGAAADSARLSINNQMSFQGVAGAKATFLSQNMYYDGSNDLRFDTASPAARLLIRNDGVTTAGSNGGVFNFQTVAAGANPIVWNSAMIIDNAGKVGIGTTSPNYPLNIANASSAGLGLTKTGGSAGDAMIYNDGSLNVVSNSGGDAIYFRGATQVFANRSTSVEIMRLNSNGTVGIGTSSPGAALQVNGAASAKSLIVRANTGTASIAEIQDSSGTPLITADYGGNSIFSAGSLYLRHDASPSIVFGAANDAYIRRSSAGALKVSGSLLVGSAGSQGIGLQVKSSNTGDITARITGASGQTVDLLQFYSDTTPVAVVDKDGRFGIGTMTPATGYKLDTAGSARIAGGLCVKNGACTTTPADGTIYASTTTVQSADLAERMPVQGEDLAAGDVVALDAAGSSSFVKSHAAYQDDVIGVLSTRPGVTLGSDTADSRPVALAGRVPVNVTLEGGPVAVGDYLVASSTPGKAMRAEDPHRGGILGVALSAYAGTAVPAKAEGDGIAHEAGHQVMMLVRPVTVTAASVAELRAENAALKAKTAALQAYLCAKDPQAAFCTK